jgi:ubiquitin C-terminal hydrolase
MTHPVLSISTQSPPAPRAKPKVPVEPSSNSNGNSKTSSLSPRSRQSRLNVRSLSLSPRNRKTTSDGQQKFRISDRRPFSSPSHIYMEVGLENLGNTCFMNSSLQCLLHIQPLVSYFLMTDIDKVLNETSPMKGLLASSFALLVREIFHASAGSSVAPVDFQKVVRRPGKVKYLLLPTIDYS